MRSSRRGPTGRAILINGTRFPKDATQQVAPPIDLHHIAGGKHLHGHIHMC
jgi:hypothetical protein